MPLSQRDQWRSRLEADLEYYESFPKRGFSGQADDALRYAVEIGISSPEHPLVVWLTQVAIQVGTPIVASGKYANPHDPWTPLGELMGKAKVLSTIAYAHAIANDGPIDNDVLRQAGAAFEEASATITKGQWDYVGQWMFHRAVRQALIVGDTSRSAELLGSKRSFRLTKTMHSFLRALTEDIQSSHTSDLSYEGEGSSRFQAMFDVLRSPDKKNFEKVFGENPGDVLLTDLEFALIKERYITGNSAAPNWRRVFESISE